MRVNENGKGHALFWATKPIQDPHQMPTMRPPLLPHYEEEMRGMRFRCLSQDSTLLLAKQEREPSKNRVKNTHNLPESHPTVLEESLCFLIPFTALWAGRLVWLGYLPDRYPGNAGGRRFKSGPAHHSTSVLPQASLPQYYRECNNAKRRTCHRGKE